MNPSLQTQCAHAGATPNDDTNAVTNALYFSSTYRYDPANLPSPTDVYARESNPTRTALENVLTKLEQGAAAAAFSSGSAAAHAVFMSLRPGDHIIVNQDVYSGIRIMLKDFFIPWGLQISFTDLTDTKNLEAAITGQTKLVWTESPTNPLLNIVDLKAVIAICKTNHIYVAVDNTFATPVLQNPILLGADIVMHSTTKYLGGHSDLTGGALITAAEDDRWKEIKHIQHIIGAVPAAFDCWLLMRGIRSLVPRMQLHVSNAKKVAAYLAGHSAIEQVLYPGLASHRGYTIAAAQMKEPGAMMSILVAGGKEKALQVVARLTCFVHATSLGGTESLIEHRKSSEGPDSATPDNLLRLSIGLEDADDLIADLKQALE